MCDCNINVLKDAKRIGRAHYICPKCGEDITLLLVMMYEVQKETEKIKRNKRRVKK